MPNLFINPLNTAIMEVTVMPAAAPVLGYPDCRYCLSHRIFVPLFIVESIQAVLWDFTFRVSKQ